MNIDSALTKIKNFDDLVIKSGFKRDLNDFIQSIQQPQNINLIFLKGISEKIKNNLDEIENNSLHSDLEKVLRDSIPFTSLDIDNSLEELDNDTEIDANTYLSKLLITLNELISRIQENETEIKSVKKIFEKYSSKDDDEDDDNEEYAILSLIFKDLESTKSLKDFSRVLHKWNRTLMIYQTLVSSESPEDISLVGIQNGSIDVVFNINVDIGIDLAKLFKIGLEVYAAYLLYKSKNAREIIASYMGNKKLVAMEKERETLMLDNIQDAIKRKVMDQHKENIKEDKNIDKTNIDKKAGEVSSVITEHIIKGNELKVLHLPYYKNNEDEEDSDEENSNQELISELRKESAIVKERYKALPGEDKQLLLEKYTIKDDPKFDE